jgi:Putative Ig domain
MAYRIIFGLLVAVSLAACNDSGDPTSAGGPNATPAAPNATPAAPNATPAAADKPVISGTPPARGVAGQAYSFQPTASDPKGSPLTFSVANAPKWAAFNTASGHLAGTPNGSETGAYPNITITASNGTASAVLPAFSITVSAQTPAASLSISGTPPTSVVVGAPYSFTPNTADPGSGKLTFSIQKAPSWATFNAATGALSGTPTAGDVGSDPNITISVSDGTKSASLPAFAIAVVQSANGSASLQWVAPTENTNGTPLTNLAGYRIYYGTSASAMTQTAQIANPTINTYLLANLTPATWYFEVKAYTTANVESSASPVASETID